MTSARVRRQLRMHEAVHRLIFLDETGKPTRMTRLRGRARHAGRLKADARPSSPDNGATA